MRTLFLGAVMAFSFALQASALSVTKPATTPTRILVQNKDACFNRCMANRCKNAQSKATCCSRICR
jgi:hypothetical protein